MSGPKKDELSGKFRTSHKEKYCNLYRSSSSVNMVTSRKLKWAEDIHRTYRKK